MMFLTKGLTALLSVCVVSTAALADVGIATISDVKGKVLVNVGEGFVPAAADMTLKVGDQVFVGEQSMATLSYDACAVLLDKPTVATVNADGGCKGATSIHPVHGQSAVTGYSTIPPGVVLTTAAILGISCLAACDSLFSDNEDSVSGR